MTVALDNFATMSDGSTLGYAECGNRNGRPVLVFHGWPSSRLEARMPLVDEMATRYNMRLVHIDRPGIGISEYRHYTLPTWADLVVDFARQQRMREFAVLGVSGGGKYAAACGWRIPQYLTSVVIVAGTCPLNAPGVKKILRKQRRYLYLLAGTAPWLLWPILWRIASKARKDPSSILSIFPDPPESDRAVMESPGVSEVLEHMVLGAFSQGIEGVYRDWILTTSPWGFSPEDIKIPVSIFHGTEDATVPVESGHILERLIPEARARFIPKEGHLSILFNHYEEVFEALVSAGA